MFNDFIIALKEYCFTHTCMILTSTYNIFLIVVYGVSTEKVACNITC